MPGPGVEKRLKLAQGSQEGAVVRLNIYNVNKTLEVANWLFLRDHNMGIYHCSVQVFDYEWSFMLFPKELAQTNAPTRTGVVQCAPRCLRSFRFCESIDIGRTTLSSSEAFHAALNISKDWPSNSYHVTRRNCISFAEALVEKLGVEPKFPEWVTNSWKMATMTPHIAHFFDSSMEFTRWQSKQGRVCTYPWF